MNGFRNWVSQFMTGCLSWTCGAEAKLVQNSGCPVFQSSISSSKPSSDQREYLGPIWSSGQYKMSLRTFLPTQKPVTGCPMVREGWAWMNVEQFVCRVDNPWWVLTNNVNEKDEEGCSRLKVNPLEKVRKVIFSRIPEWYFPTHLEKIRKKLSASLKVQIDMALVHFHSADKENQMDTCTLIHSNVLLLTFSPANFQGRSSSKEK